MGRKKTPYDTLGVGKDADAATIKKAHRKKARESHPDSGGSNDEFLEVQNAYMVLSDPARRSRYDATGDDSEPQLDNVNRLLASTFMQVVQSLIVNNMDVSRRDVFKAMIETLRNALAGIDDSIGKNQQAAAAMRRIRERITEPSPLFHSILQGQLASIEGLNAGATEQKRQHEEAIAHLKKCRYKTGAGMWETPTAASGTKFFFDIAK